MRRTRANSELSAHTEDHEVLNLLLESEDEESCVSSARSTSFANSLSQSSIRFYCR